MRHDEPPRKPDCPKSRSTPAPRAWQGAIALLGVVLSGCCAAAKTGSANRLAPSQPAPHALSRLPSPSEVERIRWPDLPRSAEGWRNLLRHHTQRDSSVAGPEITPEALLDAAAAIGWAKLVAGDRRVARWLQGWLDAASAAGRDAYLLWGTYHDSAGQVRAFDALVGPSGLRGLTHVVLEQFRADGAWGGVAPDAQRGDTSDIDAYVRRGDISAFDAIAGRQQTEDYAAWKFGYIPSVLELMVTARATGTRLLGCDMPKQLQDAAGLHRGSEELNRARELHCFLSLKDASAVTGAQTPSRVAMLWGLRHARAGGFERWLPPRAAVLSIGVWGHRPLEGSPESELARKLIVNDPVLIPLPAHDAELILLLPDAVLGGDVDRVRDGEKPESAETLHIESALRGTLSVSNQSIAVDSHGGTLSLPAGDHTYLFESGGLRIVGSLRMAPGGKVELYFDPARRVTRVVEHSPALAD